MDHIGKRKRDPQNRGYRSGACGVCPFANTASSRKDAGSALLALLILLFAFLVATFFGWSIVADSNPGSYANLQILLIPFRTALTAFALILVIPLPFVLR